MSSQVVDDQDDEEEVEVVYEEVPEPHVIETGDSVKVKQVLDEATIQAVSEAGYNINYASENLKLILMFLSCVSAMIAQFYPIPFPKSRPLLGICCALYFILSTILQFIITFVDKDTIIITKPNNVNSSILRIRTRFPRFQEYFTLIVQEHDPKSPATTAKMYVGRYFTLKGEFDEVRFQKDVVAHVKKYEASGKKSLEILYDHKSD